MCLGISQHCLDLPLYEEDASAAIVSCTRKSQLQKEIRSWHKGQRVGEQGKGSSEITQLLQLRSDSPSSTGHRICGSFDKCFNFYNRSIKDSNGRGKSSLYKITYKKGVKKFLQLP